MPINYHLMPEHNSIIFKHVGTITDDQFMMFYRTIFDIKGYSYSMNHIIDLRETDSSLRSIETLNELAHFIWSKAEDKCIHPKVAVIAPKPLSFGFARVYEGYSNQIPLEFNVFRDMEEAFEWLRLPNDIFDEIETRDN